MRYAYPYELLPQPEGGFTITFPDVPEAITQGETREEALAEAADCLEEAIAAMQKRGLKVNKLTSSTETEWRSFFDALYPKIRGNLVPADLFDEVQRLLREYRK